MGSMITSAGPGVGLARRLDGRLVGRARQRRLLDGLVESAECGGAAVVIAGETGVGKTALSTHVVGVASERGLRVLRARGEESEAVLAFATLADLMRPSREKFAELPQAHRQALEVYLALSSGPAADPLAACAGALEVLASAADEQPLAVLADDFQGVDPESRQVLLFAARRLAPERIVMLFAVCYEPGAQPSRRGLPVLRIGGLSVAECAKLARGLGANISGSAQRSLVELTGDNALVVLENLAGAADGTGGFEPGRLTFPAALLGPGHLGSPCHRFGADSGSYGGPPPRIARGVRPGVATEPCRYFAVRVSPRWEGKPSAERVGRCSYAVTRRGWRGHGRAQDEMPGWYCRRFSGFGGRRCGS